ncbi:pentatricopeptide repeat-containing protein At2g17210 [Corylus avellana]|uniref:pentatricopeptide repeat-containing protein At2g17210 n=1 Tax=Corylus avellana TaxID=13451 RepID=UPI001E201D0E|nr:pentatricopeptide repeat-containing protein At2g17210 [Corylus avellana]
MRFPTIHLPSKLPNWLSRINESSTNGRWEEVLSHYQEMKIAGVQLTDPSVFPSILKACSNVSFRRGKSMHAGLVKQGFELFTSVSNSTMDLYMKCGDLGSALGVFNCMRSRDSVSWNIMIHGFLAQRALQEGLQWFMNARVAGFEPSNSTLVLVIQACQSLRAKLEGMEVHGYVIKNAFLAICSVQNSLLSMYAEADMESAWRMFDEMCDKDVISWSVVIGGYVRSGKAQVGLHVFQEMVSEVSIEPDAVTMVSVLKACTSLGHLNLGRVVHGLVISRGFGFDIYVGNSLIDMYSKCYDADSAFEVFNEMSRRNNVSWNSILSGFVLNKKHLEALSLFYSMGKEGIEADEVALVNILQTCKYFVQPFQCKSVHCVIMRRGYESNELVLNSLIDAYAKCNLVELAWGLFDGMERRDVVSWSTMIAGFTYCGRPDEAIAVFQEMSHDAQEKLNAVAIINLLDACSASAELRKSKWAHGISIRRGLEAQVAVGTAIVEMYSKCGAIEDSWKAFEQIPEKNVVSWSAMIAAYGMNGLAREALALLAEMKQHRVQPNAVTALSVLSACSHSGLVEEGLSFFNSMLQDYGVEPGLEHYSCVVDMLGRAGKLHTAMDLIKKLPLEAAGASVWGALLSACRSHGNSELGAGAASHVLEMEPLNSAGYLLASNMYASGGSWVDAARMRRLVKERGVRVVAGYSLVHVNNKACRFLAGERCHPEAGEILGIVDQLHGCMKIGKNLLVIEC